MQALTDNLGYHVARQHQRILEGCRKQDSYWQQAQIHNRGARNLVLHIQQGLDTVSVKTHYNFIVANELSRQTRNLSTAEESYAKAADALRWYTGVVAQHGCK